MSRNSLIRTGAFGLLLALALLLGTMPAAGAEKVELNTLIEQARALDGQEVTVWGEVVGDIMRRSDEGWINIADGTATLGVRAPLAEIEKVKLAGRHGVQGDVVEVVGIFHRADPDGGELDITAKQITLLKHGKLVPEEVSRFRISLAIVFGIATLLAALFWWLKRGRPIPEHD